MQHDTEPVGDLADALTISPITIELGTDHLALGTSVEVRRRFDHAWARGFEVAASAEEGYRLRRQSDGAVLPVCFPADDVRRSSTIHLPG